MLDSHQQQKGINTIEHVVNGKTSENLTNDQSFCSETARLSINRVCRTSSPYVTVRKTYFIGAFLIWLVLSFPSLLVTFTLYSFAKTEEVESEIQLGINSTMQSSMTSSTTVSNLTKVDAFGRGKTDDHNVLISTTRREGKIKCYENYAVYQQTYMKVRYWVEGVGVGFIGFLGLCGNILTICILAMNKRSTFHCLLIYLSLTDICVIVFFMKSSLCTIILYDNPPQWFIILMPHVLWPLGNVAITCSILVVVVVSVERFQAICYPHLHYKPNVLFYITLVFSIAMCINSGRFVELELSHQTTIIESGQPNNIEKMSLNGTRKMYNYQSSALMSDSRYIVFSRYWTDVTVLGLIPLVCLIWLNYQIYREIQKGRLFRQAHVHDSKRNAVHNNTEEFDSNLLPNNSRRHKYKDCDDVMEMVDLPHSKESNDASNDHQEHTTKGASCRIRRDFVIRHGQERGNDPKSTHILVGIVLVFLVCHIFRLIIQIESILHPVDSVANDYCINTMNQFPAPVAIWILTSISTFCLVLNSSINLVIYCLVGRGFRKRLFQMLKCKK